jgi:ribosomal protein S12 methylthiotransferase accessory factor
LEVVRLGGERFLLRSDFVALELSGETAAALVERVLDGADHPLTLDEIAERLPGYRPESLKGELENLVREGVLVADGGEVAGDNRAFGALLDEIGLGAERTLARLARTTVGVMGLEAHGAHVARLLADAGVGRLELADPFPFEPVHRFLTPVNEPDALGASRELAVARHLSREGLELHTSGNESLDRAGIAGLTERCQLVIVCWDRGFHAAHHWANEAALEHGVPALFSELRATSSFAGPLYLPGRSACWMCYRMRALACEQDFDRAMSFEEHLDRKRRPGLGERPVLPVLPVQLASTLALEAIKLLIKLGQPALVDKVLEFDGLASEPRMHPVLVEPGCPVCAKKKSRLHPTAAELQGPAGGAAGPPLHELADRLVSSRTGIVVDFAPAGRDATEPPWPLVWRARLSNHRFLPEPDDSHMTVSGKGMTREEAWTSCLGEAVERYSGGCWDLDETVFCRRADLDGRSIDPTELVLFRPDQYADLPYAPYREDTKLRWVLGRSLTREDEVWIPAIAVYMEYQSPPRTSSSAL